MRLLQSATIYSHMKTQDSIKIWMLDYLPFLVMFGVSQNVDNQTILKAMLNVKHLFFPLCTHDKHTDKNYIQIQVYQSPYIFRHLQQSTRLAHSTNPPDYLVD